MLWCARFEPHGLVDSHPRRAVVPAYGRIIVARTCAGVNLVTLFVGIGPADVAQLDRVVLDLDHERVEAGAQRLGDLEFKGGEEAFV